MDHRLWRRLAVLAGIALTLGLAAVVVLGQAGVIQHPVKVRITPTEPDALCVGGAGVTPASCTGGIQGGAGILTTLDTGQGANELYDMDQNVLTTSAVTFLTVDTGQGANELYDMDQNVLTTSAVIFATVDTGQGANELYDMDQNVLTSSSPTFNALTLSSAIDALTLANNANVVWGTLGTAVLDGHDGTGVSNNFLRMVAGSVQLAVSPDPSVGAAGARLTGGSLFTDTDLLAAGNLDIDGNLDVAGVGSHVIGGAVDTSVQLRLRGAFTGGGYGLQLSSTLSPGVGGDGAPLVVRSATLLEAASGTHAILGGALFYPPTITGAGAAVTNTATLYVSGATSATVTGRNDALRVDTDSSYFGGDADIRGPHPHIDVRAYGAKGDGSTDDTAAIQAALDAVPVNDGTVEVANERGYVYLPPGLYLLSSNLTITNRATTIAGAGIEKTILKFTGGTHGISGVFTGVGGSIYAQTTFIRDLTLTTEQATGDAIHLVYPNAASHNEITVVIERVQMRPAGHTPTGDYWLRGIYCEDCWNARIDKVSMHTSEATSPANSVGIYIADLGVDSKITNFLIAGYAIGIDVEIEVEGIFIDNGTILAPSVAGVRISGNDVAPLSWVGNLHISPTGTGAIGVALVGAPQAQVFNNGIYINGNSEIGIQLTGASTSVSLYGNHILVASGTTSNGIVLESGATDCVIAFNRTSGLDGSAVWLKAGANTNTVVANIGAVVTNDGTSNMVAAVDSLTLGTTPRPLQLAGGLEIGGDVSLTRGAANRLDLASGDSMNLVSGALQVAGTEAISSARNASFATSVTLGGDVVLSRGAANRLDLASGDNFSIVSGSLTVGGAPSTSVQFLLRGTFGGSIGQEINTRVQPGVDIPGSLFFMDGTIDEASSGTHPLMAGVRLDPPIITAGSAAVTDTATLYIADAMAATVTGSNYAVWVKAGGIGVGTPTGGSKATGTINVSGDLYKNNTAYNNPAYVFEHWATGRIVRHANKRFADEYRGLRSLDEVRTYVRQHYDLPMMDQHRDAGLFDRGDLFLAALEEAYLYLFEQQDRIRALEDRARPVRPNSIH